MEYVFLTISIVALSISLILLIKFMLQNTMKEQIAKEKQIDAEINRRRDVLLHRQAAREGFKRDKYQPPLKAY